MRGEKQIRVFSFRYRKAAGAMIREKDCNCDRETDGTYLEGNIWHYETGDDVWVKVAVAFLPTRTRIWVMRSKEVAKGTSEIDPTKTPKTIDFKPTDGSEKGKTFLGIYDIKQTCRKLCYAPAGKDRPTEFSSTPGSGNVLVIFQREKP
jgi:uncharacterized protein (TIGR03067 family)